jgi:hypothetical protein
MVQDHEALTQENVRPMALHVFPAHAGHHFHKKQGTISQVGVRQNVARIKL